MWPGTLHWHRRSTQDMGIGFFLLRVDYAADVLRKMDRLKQLFEASGICGAVLDWLTESLSLYGHNVVAFRLFLHSRLPLCCPHLACQLVKSDSRWPQVMFRSPIDDYVIILASVRQHTVEPHVTADGIMWRDLPPIRAYMNRRLPLSYSLVFLFSSNYKHGKASQGNSWSRRYWLL